MRPGYKESLPAVLCALLLQAPGAAPAAEETLKSRVEAQWGELRETTAKKWVDYSELGDSLSEVDFEKGRFEVQVLLPMEAALPGRPAGAALGDLSEQDLARIKSLAEPKAAAQSLRMLSRLEPGKAPVLKDQILDPDDRFLVEAKHARRYTHDHLVPAMRVADRPVTGKDGRPRVKVTARYYLVSDHLMVRARRYSPEVAAVARSYGLDPALIYAVIHTESCFNPLALSKSGALGLMQLVPRHAAREAYKYLFKKDPPRSADYLYDPKNNIRLGAAYLHMLETRHFGRLKNLVNRRTLSIAAYNCGPNRIAKDIIARYEVDKLSRAQLHALIRKLTPVETRTYVPRVEERIDLYRKM